MMTTPDRMMTALADAGYVVRLWSVRDQCAYVISDLLAEERPRTSPRLVLIPRHSHGDGRPIYPDDPRQHVYHHDVATMPGTHIREDDSRDPLPWRIHGPGRVEGSFATAQDALDALRAAS